MNLRYIISHVAKDIGHILSRSVLDSPKSGMVCAQTHWRNLVLLSRMRLGARDRVECPCCGWSGPGFRAVDGRSMVFLECECPECGSFERQRMLHVYLTQAGADIVPQRGRILHFAPERHVHDLLRRNSTARYVAADVAPEKLLPLAAARLRTDIRRIALPNDTFDLVVCVHVLEHIDNDLTAIREIARVLRSGGYALIMVPFGMHLEETVEFGKPDPNMFDHVRDYSPVDFRNRLEGVEVSEIRPHDILTSEQQACYGIRDCDIMHLCRKPQVREEEA